MSTGYDNNIPKHYDANTTNLLLSLPYGKGKKFFKETENKKMKPIGKGFILKKNNKEKYILYRYGIPGKTIRIKPVTIN